jgi:ATP-dependent RNA helicase DeaD
VHIKSKTTTLATTTQRYLTVHQSQKLDALTRILEVENFEAMIIFARTKQETEQLAERLRARGFSAVALNGDVAQAQRERTIQQLKSGRLDILVATDVAARGLDVDRISHVLNYDIPTDTESYVHRIGRTGRAGRSGDAISFVTPKESRLLRAIEKATRQELTPMPLPTVEDVNSTRLGKFDDAISAALESESVDFFRDVVAHYVREHDVPEVDVAAALAVVLQGDTPLLLEADPAPAERGTGRGPSDRGERRERRSGSRPELATYRINVGRRHRIQPRQIVGALANEGGLGRDDFGHIDIRIDHSLVELPAQLPARTWEALADTRISGKLIELSRADGGPRKGGRKQRPRG